MIDPQIKIEDVLASLRETIANQAQEIAILRASVKALSSKDGE